MLPVESTVSRVENQTIGSDRPSMQLVAGKTNCADGVALGLGVLPLPSALGDLGEGSMRKQRRQERRETEPP